MNYKPIFYILVSCSENYFTSFNICSCIFGEAPELKPAEVRHHREHSSYMSSRGSRTSARPAENRTNRRQWTPGIPERRYRPRRDEDRDRRRDDARDRRDDESHDRERD